MCQIAVRITSVATALPPIPSDPLEYNRACVVPGTGERWIDETQILLTKLHDNSSHKERSNA